MKVRDQLKQEKMQQKQHQITANRKKGRSKTQIQYPFIQHLIQGINVQKTETFTLTTSNLRQGHINKPYSEVVQNYFKINQISTKQ